MRLNFIIQFLQKRMAILMDVTYLRFQDDILILCKTKRQLMRCKQRMMQVLNERHLCLSRKKNRMGNIDRRFHFLTLEKVFAPLTY